MTVLFDNVDGCALTIQDIHSSIPFSTPSDALFSSLFVKFNNTVPWELFDDLLALFRRADFHTNAITIKGPEDISEHIAVQRQRIARSRDSTRGNDRNATDCHPQVTNVIPALIAEYIHSQHSQFHRAIDKDEPADDWESTCYILGNMSLVHRSWTDVAQRYLRKRMIILNPRSLRSVLQSPMIGPWVRELSLVGHAESQISAVKESPRLMVDVLRRCPNLTHLDLNMYRAQLPIGKNFDIIGQLAYLKNLEYLWLRLHQSICHQEIRKLARVLQNLRYLKSLNLQSWKAQSVDHDPIPFDVPVPSATLEAVSLSDVDVVNSSILGWLLAPQNGVLKLELHISELEYDQFNDDMDNMCLSLKKATTTHITTLRLVGCRSMYMLNLILELFPSLQVLSVCPDDVTDLGLKEPFNSLVLPNDTTRSFHYHYYEYPNADQDPLALAMLKAHPSIRQLYITYSFSDYAFDEEPHENWMSFENSIKYAEKNNIEMKVTKAEFEDLPHISEM